MVRKGNENLLKDNPQINNVIVWDKSKNKYKNLFNLSKKIRANNYNKVYNLQRFAASGFLTWRSNADIKVGYDKNPFAFTFNFKVKHEIGDGGHEIDRNLKLLNADPENGFEKAEKPKLYPSNLDQSKIEELTKNDDSFIVFAPASVWFTKQLPQEKWIELGQRFLSEKSKIYFVGAPSDIGLIDNIIEGIGKSIDQLVNLAGELTLMESAVLIGKAKKSFVNDLEPSSCAAFALNDSAPLHLASAMNAPVVAFFCSTIPTFGFGPLSSDQQIIQTSEKLNCRPCGLHGYKQCPKGHFKCGMNIDISAIKN